MRTRTDLREIRERRGISIAQLARLTGVSRQTIYSIEAGEYVPNTAHALQLAQVLEVRVEDLFALEDDTPAPAKLLEIEMLGSEAREGQPLEICRVGKRAIGMEASAQPLALPVADGVVVKASGRRAQARLFPGEFEDGNRLLIAGCDPGVSLLARQMARAGGDLRIAACSSYQALEWLKQGSVHIAGAHLRDSSSGEYNLPVVARLFPKGAIKVVTFAIWEQGLVLAPGNPKGIRRVEDLARKDVRIVNREKGAGSRDLLDQALRQAGIAARNIRGYDSLARGHLAAALAVSRGEADGCIATRSAARAFGLSFLAMATERYDLVVRRTLARTAPVRMLFDLLNRAEMRRKLEMLAGYDTSRTGDVLIG